MVFVLLKRKYISSFLGVFVLNSAFCKLVLIQHIYFRKIMFHIDVTYMKFDSLLS